MITGPLSNTLTSGKVSFFVIFVCEIREGRVSHLAEYLEYLYIAM